MDISVCMCTGRRIYTNELAEYAAEMVAPAKSNIEGLEFAGESPQLYCYSDSTCGTTSRGSCTRGRGEQATPVGRLLVQRLSA